MESDEEDDYKKLLRRPEWHKRRAEILPKSARCAKCGRTGARLAVHHPEYQYGCMPWDYPDDAYMVVCSGRCHREADADKEEQERDARNYKQYPWQWELGKKEQPPRDRELRKLAKHEPEFKAWLKRTIVPEEWDWNNRMYPLWWFWNQFSEKFLSEQRAHDPQGRLAL